MMQDTLAVKCDTVGVVSALFLLASLPLLFAKLCFLNFEPTSGVSITLVCRPGSNR